MYIFHGQDQKIKIVCCPHRELHVPHEKRGLQKTSQEELMECSLGSLATVPCDAAKPFPGFRLAPQEKRLQERGPQQALKAFPVLGFCDAKGEARVPTPGGV